MPLIFRAEEYSAAWTGAAAARPSPATAVVAAAAVRTRRMRMRNPPSVVRMERPEHIESDQYVEKKR
jgi:hypothetical protein